MQLLLYFLIGGVSAINNIFLFSLLFYAGLGITTAVSTAFVGAAIINYMLCITILFKHKARWSTTGELMAYLSTLAIMGTFDVGLTVFLTNVGMHPTISKSFAALIGFFGNFALRKYLVFPEKAMAQT